MLELILVRHGETNSNKKGTYLGWTDIDLNAEGIRQAYLTKEKLKGIKVNKIFSSPLKRAKKTAQIVNENYNLEIIYSDCLNERNFGIWDDLTHEDIVSRYHEEYDKWIGDWVNYRIRDGESALESYLRVVEYTRDFIVSRDTGTYVVVAHMGTIRFMLTYLLGMNIEDSWRFRLNNCSISKVEISDGYAVLTLFNG